jgi:chemotaxis protein methyltransferase CheR
VLDLYPEAARHDIRILATDVDPAILARARDGIYDNDELKALPEATRSQHTAPAGPSRFAIGDKARALISFGELNLMKDWPMRGTFDVIFCRNVAIYFDKDTQARLWSRFADLLPTGGHLCIGHSERVAGPASAVLETVGVTTYRKTAARPGDAKKPPVEGTAR